MSKVTLNKAGLFYQPMPVEKASSTKQQHEVKKDQNSSRNSFAEELQKVRQDKEITFSAHAKQRMEAREIQLSPEDVGKLEEAVDKAEEKGSRSSLLLYGDMAFVAGVKDRTIVTALQGQSMKEHVFTNIDSAVIVD